MLMVYACMIFLRQIVFWRHFLSREKTIWQSTSAEKSVEVCFDFLYKTNIKLFYSSSIYFTKITTILALKMEMNATVVKIPRISFQHRNLNVILNVMETALNIVAVIGALISIKISETIPKNQRSSLRNLCHTFISRALLKWKKYSMEILKLKTA